MSGAALMVLSSINKPRGAYLPAILSVYSTYTGSPTTASFTFRSDGLYDSVGDVDSSPSGTWQSGSGTGANYDVKAELDSGSLTSGVTGAWLNLGSNITWAITGSAGDIAILSVQIRDAATLTVLASCDLDITVGF